MESQMGLTEDKSYQTKTMLLMMISGGRGAVVLPQ